MTFDNKTIEQQLALFDACVAGMDFWAAFNAIARGAIPRH